MTKCFGLLVLALIVFAGSNAHSTLAAGIATELLTPSRASNPLAETKSKRSDPDRDVPIDAADEDRTMASFKPVMGKVANARQVSFSTSPVSLEAKAIARLRVKPQRSMKKRLENESIGKIYQVISNRERATKQLQDAVAKLLREKGKSTDSKNEHVIRAAGQVETAEAQLKKAAAEFELYASKHMLRRHM
ncbi:unnamed protein product [Hyaloperonospora brassicae]|uniref:RxLR effector protein n=1 Tax=Hyaloperonospora brassicae TaxID=162125 RepID=A0AAV0UNF7_HYABA|nr:unnamed protein product [Hyaloperonospora brassicae]